MKPAWRTLAVVLATLGISVGFAWIAHADDDDDDNDSSSQTSQTSIESWPPTQLSWPPLSVPEDDDSQDTSPAVPLP